MYFQKAILLTVIVLALSGFADKKTNCDWFDDNLKGHVKQVREEEKIVPSPKDTLHRVPVNENPYAYSIWTYNEQGNAKEKNYYDDKGRLAYQEKTTYNDHGLKTERVTRALVNGILQTTEQYLYVQGKLAESVQFNSENIKTKQIKYDSNGNAYQTINFNPDGITERKTDTKFKFDGAGRVIEEDDYADDTMYTGKTTYKYDDMGNQSEVDMYNKRNVIIQKRVIANTYDSLCNLVGIVEAYVKTEGILRFSLKQAIKYDAAGNRIEEDGYTVKGKIEQPGNVRLYEYDKTGNWIKRTDIRHSGEKDISTRAIQYY